MPDTPNPYFVRKSIHEPIWQDRQPLLTHLDVELTERCNNACLHCYINLPQGDVQAAGQELSTEEWKAVLQEAAHLGALTVRMTGGEPLLRPDFIDIYLFTRRLGLQVQLFTNARLITPELADLFARIPPRQKIEITVYGMMQESYEAAACAPGSYLQFCQGINYLLERRVPFTVKMALLPPNLHEREAFAQWSASLPNNEGQPGYVVTLQMRGRRDNPNRNKLVQKIRLPPEEVAEILTPKDSSNLQTTLEFCRRFMGPAGETLFTCGAGQGGCVDAYGRFQPCMLLRAPQLSFDLRRGTLKEALTDFFPILRQLKASNPDYLERCAVCFLHGLCEQCPAHSWSEHGTLDAPVEYLCQIAHAQALRLGLLREGEKAWEVRDWQVRLQQITYELL